MGLQHPVQRAAQRRASTDVMRAMREQVLEGSMGCGHSAASRPLCNEPAVADTEGFRVTRFVCITMCVMWGQVEWLVTL